MAAVDDFAWQRTSTPVVSEVAFRQSGTPGALPERRRRLDVLARFPIAKVNSFAATRMVRWRWFFEVGALCFGLWYFDDRMISIAFGPCC